MRAPRSAVRLSSHKAQAHLQLVALPPRHFCVSRKCRKVTYVPGTERYRCPKAEDWTNSVWIM
jgi:hypothetical protein